MTDGLTIFQCGGKRVTDCPKSPDGKHDMSGPWREFDDGLGGESTCKWCGIGAMAISLWTEG
jgi:hypothetical protein